MQLELSIMSEEYQGDSFQFTPEQIDQLAQIRSNVPDLTTMINYVLTLSGTSKNIYIKTNCNENTVSFVTDGSGEDRNSDNFINKFLYLFSTVDFIELYSKCANQKLFCMTTTGETEFNIYDIDTEATQESGTNLTLHVKMDLFNEFIKLLEVVCKNNQQSMIYINGHLTNRSQMLWLKNKDEITDKEYKTLFKTISNDKYEPYTYTHFNTEGIYNFSVILYIPYTPPEYVVKLKNTVNKVHLYVNHEFISDTCDELIPEYLNFVVGIIDTDDQSPKCMNIIKKHLSKKILEMIQNITSDEVLYNVFYSNYAKYIKLGIHDDDDNREKLIQFLRYYSTNSEHLTSLDSYISRPSRAVGVNTSRATCCDGSLGSRTEGKDKNIYYISGDSLTNLSTSTHLEIYRKNNIEVIFMDDPMDEYCLLKMTEYKGYKFLNITRETEINENHKNNPLEIVCSRIKESLGNYVSHVKLTNKLVDSPCCVTIGNGWTSNMEKIMKSRAQSDPKLIEKMKSDKYFNINPNNQLIKKIHEIIINGEDKTPEFDNLIILMYETALQDAGYPVLSGKMYSLRVYSMIYHGLGLGIEM